MGKKIPYYTFYDNKTDEILCFGTAEELVSKGDFPTMNAFRSMLCRVKKCERPRRAVVVEYITEDNDGKQQTKRSQVREISRKDSAK